MITDKVRRQVFDRDGGCCVVCATPIGLTIQHRVNRQMGGSQLLDFPENLLTMCAAHNQALEADARFAQRGREKGWKLPSWEDPKEVPVRYPDGLLYALTGLDRKVVE